MARIRLPVAIAAVVVAAGLVLACSDATGPGDAPSFTGTETTLAHGKSTPSTDGSPPPDGVPPQGYVYCTPLPYASGTATIGPSGGTIAAGKHKFTVPKNALAEPVTITLEAPSDTINYVRLSPHGLTFRPGYKPKLKLDYSNCPNPKLATKGIVYSSDSWKLLEKLKSTDDQSLSVVEADLDHFSRYAIHY